MKKITLELVVECIRFLIDNKSMTQEEVRHGLSSLGWSFTWDDFERQFAVTHGTLADGLRKGRTSAGASVLMNIMYSDYYGWAFCYDRFFAEDGDATAYQFLRAAEKRLKIRRVLGLDQ